MAATADSWAGFPVRVDDRVERGTIGFVRPGIPPRLLGAIKGLQTRQQPQNKGGQMATAAPDAPPEAGTGGLPADTEGDAGPTTPQTPGSVGKPVTDKKETRQTQYLVMTAPGNTTLVDVGDGSSLPDDHPDVRKLEAGDAPDDTSPGVTQIVGVYEASGQRGAKSAALDENDHLDEQVSQGGVWLIAVPLSSWHPTLVKEEQPPPVRRGL